VPLGHATHSFDRPSRYVPSPQTFTVVVVVVVVVVELDVLEVVVVVVDVVVVVVVVDAHTTFDVDVPADWTNSSAAHCV